jgi:hypothetical protein
MKKVITTKPKVSMSAEDINTIIKEVLTAYKKYGSNSHQFKSLYCANFKQLEKHKVSTLKSNYGKKLNVYGYLIRRGDGEDKNLNLISPLWVNGTQIEHLHVYDGVIDVLNINSSGMFSSDNLEVFTYLRKEGSSAYGLKPVGEDSYKYSARKK